MRRILSVLLVMVAATVAMAAEPGDAQQTEDERQAELDRRCEAARQLELAPIREDIYAECLEKKRGDAAFCRRNADGYNGNRIGGSPRFYELPECQAAFDYRNLHKR